MTTTRRFYELTPSWPSGARPTVKMDGWNFALTASVPFDFLETWFENRVPTGARLNTRPRKQVPELILTGADSPIVSAGFKSVLEKVAPGEAEFRPFALRFADDSPVPGEWHLANLMRRVDAFDFARMGSEPPDPEDVKKQLKDTRTNPITDEEYWLREGYYNEMMGAKYVDPAKIINVHIFRPRWHPNSIFVTSEMLKAFKDAGVKGLHAERLGTSDEPLPTFADFKAKATAPQRT
jgi:hypothetical protein